MIETTVEAQHNLTIYKCSGNLTEQEIVDKIQSFFNGSPMPYVLLDFSLACMTNISQQTIEKISSLARKRGSTRRAGKTAIVAP